MPTSVFACGLIVFTQIHVCFQQKARNYSTLYDKRRLFEDYTKEISRCPMCRGCNQNAGYYTLQLIETIDTMDAITAPECNHTAGENDSENNDPSISDASSLIKDEDCFSNDGSKPEMMTITTYENVDSPSPPPPHLDRDAKEYNGIHKVFIEKLPRITCASCYHQHFYRGVKTPPVVYNNDFEKFSDDLFRNVFDEKIQRVINEPSIVSIRLETRCYVCERERRVVSQETEPNTSSSESSTRRDDSDVNNQNKANNAPYKLFLDIEECEEGCEDGFLSLSSSNNEIDVVEDHILSMSLEDCYVRDQVDFTIYVCSNDCKKAFHAMIEGMNWSQEILDENYNHPDYRTHTIKTIHNLLLQSSYDDIFLPSCESTCNHENIAESILSQRPSTGFRPITTTINNLSLSESRPPLREITNHRFSNHQNIDDSKNIVEPRVYDPPTPSRFPLDSCFYCSKSSTPNHKNQLVFDACHACRKNFCNKDDQCRKRHQTIHNLRGKTLITSEIMLNPFGLVKNNKTELYPVITMEERT